MKHAARLFCLIAGLLLALRIAGAVMPPGSGPASGLVISGITINFTANGDYPAGSSVIPNGGTIYIGGGCTSGVQIATLTPSVIGSVPYAGAWGVLGTDAAKFTISGSTVGILRCNTSLAAGASFSITVSAGPPSSPYLLPVTLYNAQDYYVAASGCSDSNSGLSNGSPWCSVNHTGINCGDFVHAATGAYNSALFAGSFNGGTNNWKAATCAGNDNVAWLKCATAFACTFTNFQPSGAIEIAANYWGVQGFNCVSPTGTVCFEADPPTNSTHIHHVVFANNICDGTSATNIVGCVQTLYYASGNGGGNHGVDYVAWIGNVAYQGALSTAYCGSNFDDVGATNIDTASGAHRYAAWNISYQSVGGVGCASAPSGQTTDANGGIIDYPQALNTTGPIVWEDNLIFNNGGRGFQVYAPNMPSISGTVLSVTFRYNTLYKQFQNTNFNSANNDLSFYTNGGNYILANAQWNIIQETVASSYYGNGSLTHQTYPLGSVIINSGSVLDNNWLKQAPGATYAITNYDEGYNCASGPNVPYNSGGTNMSCNGNVTGTDPLFAGTFTPAAPSCSGQPDTNTCYATQIGYFLPTARGTTVGGTKVSAANYGFNSHPSVCDALNTSAWILWAERALPAALDKCG